MATEFRTDTSPDADPIDSVDADAAREAMIKDNASRFVPAIPGRREEGQPASPDMSPRAAMVARDRARFVPRR